VSKPKAVTAVQLVRLVERLDFRFVRQSGSHATYRHPDRRWTIIPIHKGRTIGKGLLRKILNDLDLTVDQFNEMV